MPYCWAIWSSEISARAEPLATTMSVSDAARTNVPMDVMATSLVVSFATLLDWRQTGSDGDACALHLTQIADDRAAAVADVPQHGFARLRARTVANGGQDRRVLGDGGRHAQDRKAFERASKDQSIEDIGKQLAQNRISRLLGNAQMEGLVGEHAEAPADRRTRQDPRIRLVQSRKLFDERLCSLLHGGRGRMTLDTDPRLDEVRRLIGADPPDDEAAILKRADQPFRLELAHGLAHRCAAQPQALGDVVERHLVAGSQTLRQQHALELALHTGQRIGLIGQNEAE